MIKQLIQKIFCKSSEGLIQTTTSYTLEPLNKYEYRNRLAEKIEKFSTSVLFGESRAVDTIVIHCSECKSNEILNFDDAELFFKRKYGKKIVYTNSFIPFHFLITENGYIVNTMPLNAPDVNSSSTISICYIGGVNQDGEHADTRTNEQKESMLWLISTLSRLLCIRKTILSGDACFDGYNEYK